MEWSELRERLIDRIRPEDEEKRLVQGFCLRVSRELSEKLIEAGFKAVAEVHGSVAKGTWLSGERDVDIFIVLDSSYDRDAIPSVLEVVKGYLSTGWVEAYAEHPYLRARIDEFQVDFVPCFRIGPGEPLKSATDRTPLHTAYVKKNLKPKQLDEVRLLKRFMKGVGVYGAELKISGFSGYLSELLIIHYGSFETLLEAAANWRRGTIIQLQVGLDPRELRRRFVAPLIVVDPVDPNRNVAAPVSEDSFWTFVAASRGFLKEPEELYFYPPDIETSTGEVLEAVRRRGSDLLFIVIPDREVDVPDILWGQLYKAKKILEGLLERWGFKVLRSAVWSDETSRHILLYELETSRLPEIERHMGPPVEVIEHSERFLRRHLDSPETLSGPWIEEGRWWILTRRRWTKAEELLTHHLEVDGGRDIGIPKRLSKRIREEFKILLNDEIELQLEGEFLRFLHLFLKGRASWHSLIHKFSQ